MDLRELTINIDMDGVIYDFNAAMHGLAEEYLGRELPDTGAWDMWNGWGISKTQWYKLFDRAIQEGDVFSIGHEVPFAIEAVHKLIEDGHRVRIVTSKLLVNPESTRLAQLQTINWLSRADLNKVELCFAHNKQGYLADVIVDDKPTMAWAQRGALNLLFSQPWNENVPDEAYFGPTEITRAEGWGDVLMQVDYLAHPLSAAEVSEPGAGGL